MTLAEVRKKLVTLSGRYDLVEDAIDYDDNGADFFIQAGQRWLDRELAFEGELASITISLATSAYAVSLEASRAVKQVGVMDSEEFDYLQKRSYSDLKKLSAVTSGVDSDRPSYYALGIGRSSVSAVTSLADKELIVWPPADKQYTLVVEGQYQSNPLVQDDSVSFWSEYYPDMLIKAALMKAEPFNRNSTGERDYRQSLLADLLQLDHDVVEEQIAEIDRVDNSWREIKS